jgi:hypothetical protein
LQHHRNKICLIFCAVDDWLSKRYWHCNVPCLPPPGLCIEYYRSSWTVYRSSCITGSVYTMCCYPPTPCSVASLLLGCCSDERCPGEWQI